MMAPQGSAHRPRVGEWRCRERREWLRLEPARERPRAGQRAAMPGASPRHTARRGAVRKEENARTANACAPRSGEELKTTWAKT